MNYTETSDKQKEILSLLFRFRLLTIKQTQQLLHHKSHKTIITWLNNLVKNEFLGKLEGQKLPGGNVPAVFYLKKKGLKLLKGQLDIEKTYLNKMRYEEKKKQPFIDECCFVVDTFINLFSQSLKDKFSLKFYTSNNFPKKAKIRKLNPSFAYVVEKNGKRYQYCCEYIHERTPRRVLFSRIYSYLYYFLADQSSSPMHIKFICQTEKRYKQAINYTKKLFKDEDIMNLNINFAYESDVRKYGITKQIWEEVKYISN